MIAAVFDVDRTLLPGTTAERIFIRFLIRERVLGLHGALATLRCLVTSGHEGLIDAIRRHRPYLRGQRESSLIELGSRCFDEAIRPRMSLRGIERVRRHLADGHRAVLLSGSLPFVIQPMALSLGVEHVICSRLDVRGQRLTGRLVGLHPYGAAKAVLIRRWAAENGVALGDSYCYADHHSDEVVLRLFGHPVCINPSERLGVLAQRLGWVVEEFR